MGAEVGEPVEDRPAPLGEQQPLERAAHVVEAGVPGISIPSGLAEEDGLPVGIQFLAPARQDARLYRVGAALEALLVDAWGGPLLDRAPVRGGVA